MRPLSLGILITVSVLVGLVTATAAAQSYGTGDQVLAVDASEFLGQDIVGGLSNEGYLYSFGGADLTVYASLVLPDGAEITQICLYARNENPDNVVQLGLQAVHLAAGGQAPGVVDVTGSLVVADFHFGYGTVCTDPISYVFHDVDGGGNPEAVAHRLWAYVPYSAAPLGAFALGGARITWHRTVSPPPDSPTFTDVPADHLFYQYIEALSASGITAGCGDGKFCPDAPLTRGQMAVFLSFALGLHWVQ
ncbi:MAG TPA: S-layer homology domain-containing protein [Thermoanaerobaculia bacterium]